MFLLGFPLVAFAQKVGPARPNFNECNNAAENGILEIGCWGYKVCLNDVVVSRPCAQGRVLERDSMKCIIPGTGHTDCGLNTICVGKNGTYADYGDHCQTYFTCINGFFQGRYYCPANLRFNEALGVCDYPGALADPCNALPVVG